MTTFISREKLSKKSWVENSWKCCGFQLFSCCRLWFHEKNWVKMFGFLVKIEFLDKNWLFEYILYLLAHKILITKSLRLADNGLKIGWLEGKACMLHFPYLLRKDVGKLRHIRSGSPACPWTSNFIFLTWVFLSSSSLRKVAGSWVIVGEAETILMRFSLDRLRLQSNSLSSSRLCLRRQPRKSDLKYL